MIAKEFDILFKVSVFFITINTIGAFITIFRKPRSIASIFAWMMTLVFIPGFGFLLYLFCGRGIDGEIVYKYTEKYQGRITEINRSIQEYNLQYHQTVKTPESNLLKNYFRNTEESPLSKGNDIAFYTDGYTKFEYLFKDIRQAKHHIHIEYYAIFKDQIGTQLRDLLVSKANEGIEVRLIFDPWGGNVNMRFFKPLIDAGGQVVPFITSRNLIKKTRLNYHLHRKIVVIDSVIGWTGGFNVGDQYLGKSKKFGPWRDTHGRIFGTAVFTLQEIFIRDWNASAIKKANKMDYVDEYFQLPTYDPKRNISMQIVADGPENFEEILYGGFIKMILAAEKRVWLQSPYLIPNDTMINALLIAVRSGIDVRIMIPSMPDHPFIYRATQYYANYLTKRGAKVYLYQEGFIHAKTVIMDDTIASFGTTNQDIRSYSLNFEVSAFVYNRDVVDTLTGHFEDDMTRCILLTNEMIAEQSYWLRFKQNFSRLLSPIL